MDFNAIGDDGAKAIAEVLKFNTGLTFSASAIALAPSSRMELPRRFGAA